MLGQQESPTSDNVDATILVALCIEKDELTTKTAEELRSCNVVN